MGGRSSGFFWNCFGPKVVWEGPWFHWQMMKISSSPTLQSQWPGLLIWRDAFVDEVNASQVNSITIKLPSQLSQYLFRSLISLHLSETFTQLGGWRWLPTAAACSSNLSRLIMILSLWRRRSEADLRSVFFFSCRKIKAKFSWVDGPKSKITHMRTLHISLDKSKTLLWDCFCKP